VSALLPLSELHNVQPEKVRYWVIGDTHFGHSEIKKHTRRPEDVDARICRNWRRLVAPQDIIIHLGDVAWLFAVKQGWIQTLPGMKILIRGNHDSKSISWWMKHSGFAYACDGLVMSGIYFSHRPSKHLPAGATLNIHGHCRNRWPRGLRVYPHCRLFALEYERYEPRIISSFVSSINREKPFVVHSAAMQAIRYIFSWKKV